MKNISLTLTTARALDALLTRALDATVQGGFADGDPCCSGDDRRHAEALLALVRETFPALAAEATARDEARIADIRRWNEEQRARDAADRRRDRARGW